jgi:hypothetical protein
MHAQTDGDDAHVRAVSQIFESLYSLSMPSCIFKIPLAATQMMDVGTEHIGLDARQGRSNNKGVPEQ